MRNFALAAAAILMLACAWYIAHIIRNPPTSRVEDGLAMAEAQAELVPPGGVLVIGDSIAARNYLPSLCGRHVFNASVGWSTSHDWRPHAEQLVRKVKPSFVILALGNNDRRDDWQDDYRAIAKLADVAVTPKQPEKAAFIRSLLPTVPVPADTFDGTHLTTAGAREWTRRVSSLCPKQ